MASDTFEVWVNLLNKNQPQLVETLAVDRAIIQDRDIRYILDTLPAQAEARIDQKSLKPYIGVDLFYGKEGSVKGLVFVTHSHALVVRIPDNAAKTSAERYEKKKLEQLEDRPKPAPRAKYKGQKQKQPLPEKTAYERLRQLLDANLAAFGMAQISLTLWDTLRERVDGVNLSTVTSEAIPAPARKVPDPNALASNESDDEAQGKGGKGGQSRGRGGNGQRGRRSRGGRGGGRSRGQGQGRNNEDKVEHKRLQMIDGPELPEDKEECRDRKLLSPGYVVNKLYPHVSRMDINSVFFGEDQESEMLSRVAEAISRAWIAHLVANHKEVNPLVQEAPIIKPSRLNDEELTFFSKSMVAAWRVMGEEEAERAIEKEDIRQEKNQIISQSHKKRIKASKNQEIRVRTKEGEDKVYYGKKVRRNTKAVRLGENELTSEEEEVPKKDNRDEAGPSRGKKNGHHRHTFKDMPNGADEFTSDAVRPVDEEGDEPGELPLFDIDNLESVVVYGRAEATRSEDSRDMFILRLLEGRAALRGEEFEDCEFIRRVWFPTQVQTAMGKKREAKNAEKLGPKKKERYDWVEDSWGDDTDEEEAAHVSKNKVPDSELRDSDTEDDELGYDLQASVIRRLIPALENDPNTSQMQVIGRITAPNPKGRTRATLVHGPPGTGKTSTISAAAVRLLKSGEYIWIVAQSNAGISNVAKSLQKIDFHDFVLIVAEEYYSWWEGQYATLLPYVIRTTNLNDKNKKTKEHLQGKRLILCTLASLSNPAVEKLVMFRHVPLRNLIIDEASQIDMTSEFMHLFFRHRNTLRNVCWFGDPMQLPPYGWSETAKINDIFKVEHLQANSKLMNISYRLPIPIADFIGKEVYQSQLQHHSGHKVKTPTQAMLFVDTLDGEELKEEKGTSFMNHVEAEVVVQIIELYYNKINEKTGEPYEFTVITPYEAQRRLVQGMLKSKGINREVYNVDSFQGNEADFIITTLTKTTFSSFLSSINRLNVLLTRCKKGLVVVSKKEFITRTGGLLRGLWWEYESHDIWKDSRDVIKGHVDLPGSPAPNPPNEGSEEESEDEDSGDE